MSVHGHRGPRRGGPRGRNGQRGRAIGGPGHAPRRSLPSSRTAFDGKHAVGAEASRANRAGKLVATDARGLLPGNIVKPSWDNLQRVPAGFADGIDDGITGIVITRVRRDSFEVEANGDVVASVDCPAGSKAISGGFTTTPSVSSP